LDEGGETLIKTDVGSESALTGGGLRLTGTVPKDAPPGLYLLTHIEQIRKADGQSRSISADELPNAPELEILFPAESDWPKVSF
jgi:hypothetical protein